MAIAPTATHRVLSLLEANLVALRNAEFERLVLAREWALAHLVTDPGHLADPRRLPTPLGAVGLAVDEYAAAELAAALGMHPLAGRHLMADAVDIEARLPRLLDVCSRGRIEVWVARKIAAATSRLTGDQARWVDESLTECWAPCRRGGCCGWSRPGWSKPTRRSRTGWPRSRPRRARCG